MLKRKVYSIINRKRVTFNCRTGYKMRSSILHLIQSVGPAANCSPSFLCLIQCVGAAAKLHLQGDKISPGPEVIKLFSCSTQLSMKFFLLINVKMPTIVGILTFMSGKNNILGLSETKKS